MTAKELVKQMTIDEKASLCSGKDFWRLKGVERLGIPSIMMADGPHGLRKQIGEGDNFGINESLPSICFPNAVLMASSWDTDLMYDIGVRLGNICRAEKVSVLLGPGINIKRSPLCGRNFEYYSEDPVCSGVLGAAFIKGVQSRGVGTSLKHFAANNQEYRRMTIDTLVDERTLREIYLAGFEYAVKNAKPYTVMAAYNRVNGQYASEDPYLIREVLRGEYKYDGVVVTDWGACNDRIKGLQAGQHLQMPSSGGITDKMIKRAIDVDMIDESLLDRRVEKVVELIEKTKHVLELDEVIDMEDYHYYTTHVAEESMILLKNDAILPLNKRLKITIVGALAQQVKIQGAGSSKIIPTKEISVLDVFENEKIDFNYSEGYTLKDDEDRRVINRAIEDSERSDITIVFLGLTDEYESEGLDREHMRLPDNQLKLMDGLIKAGRRIVVCLQNGSPIEMPWISDVSAVYEMYLCGQGGAQAIFNLLYGFKNPSGKLSETFPRNLEETPNYKYFPMGPRHVEYRESVYVGYRYYDTFEKHVLFPFGHGLSYTTFEYLGMTLSETHLECHDTLVVEVVIKNIGAVGGAEVVQVYVTDTDSSIYRPVQELKAFKKVYLEADEERTLRFELDRRAFAFYNALVDTWQVESGNFEIRVGASSRDIRLISHLFVESKDDYDLSAFKMFEKVVPEYYGKAESFEISKEDFANLYGERIPRNRIHKMIHLTSTVGDVRKKWLGEILFRQISKHVHSEIDIIGSSKMEEAVINDTPLRNIVLMSDGRLSYHLLKGFIHLLNGKWIEGFKRIIGSFRIKDSY